jgi:hypothetical protein
VRSVWRADVELRPWEARFEIADRRVVGPAALEDALSLAMSRPPRPGGPGPMEPAGSVSDIGHATRSGSGV